MEIKIEHEKDVGLVICGIVLKGDLVVRAVSDIRGYVAIAIVPESSEDNAEFLIEMPKGTALAVRSELDAVIRRN